MFNPLKITFHKPLSLPHHNIHFSPYNPNPNSNQYKHNHLLTLQKLNTNTKRVTRSEPKPNRQPYFPQSHKISQLNLNSIKNTPARQPQLLNFKNNPKIKTNITNRIYTEKNHRKQQQQQEHSAENTKAKNSINKINHQVNSKMLKKSLPIRLKKNGSAKKAMHGCNEDQKTVNSKKTKEKKDQCKYYKKLTDFQRQEISIYEVFYISCRRIHLRSDFTDGQGDPKIKIGDSIGYRYEVVKQLGKGSFGHVFKVLDHKKKQLVALKIIRAQQKFRKQAEVEIRILECGLLNDPQLKCNLVRMKGSLIFRGHPCIIFELLDKNLYQFLKENSFCGFSSDLIRRFAIQILQCLVFLSRKGIVHCDLKPENILLKEENKSGLKVIDVGSGCFQDEQLYTYIQSRFYRAPEIILGIKYTCAIDMWSFGCILVELYTGFPLFPGESQTQQILMFIQMFGFPPPEILKLAERRNKFFHQNLQLKVTQEKGRERVPNSLTIADILTTDDQLFLDLISKCFQWNPKKRITPKQALLHQWVVSGLPDTIRQKHIHQVTSQ